VERRWTVIGERTGAQDTTPVLLVEALLDDRRRIVAVDRDPLPTDNDRKRRIVGKCAVILDHPGYDRDIVRDDVLVLVGHGVSVPWEPSMRNGYVGLMRRMRLTIARPTPSSIPRVD